MLGVGLFVVSLGVSCYLYQASVPQDDLHKNFSDSVRVQVNKVEEK